MVACGLVASPALRLSRHALSLDMLAEVVPGTEFRHVAFRQARAPSRSLHVYLDGDGTPWVRGRPAPDPTPRSPLVLDLMALDPAPSVYLGRPCYHGLAATPPCSSALWTGERYSPAVVTSMAAALRHILREGGFDHVAWFGYSGGGTLAVLLAPRFPETTDVVTIAANLEIDAWADLHGYARLTGSVNPATQPPLPAAIRQRHYVGSNDRRVPRDVTARGPIGPGTVTVVPGYDHVCCWSAIWPAVLADVAGAPPSSR